MGSFLSGVHARTSSLDAVAAAVTPLLEEPGLVAASGPGWVSAVQGGASLQDPERLAQAASGLARELEVATVGFSLYDGDLPTVVLAREDGEAVVVRTGAGVEADPEALARFVDAAATLSEVGGDAAERLAAPCRGSTGFWQPEPDPSWTTSPGGSTWTTRPSCRRCPTPDAMWTRFIPVTATRRSTSPSISTGGSR